MAPNNSDHKTSFGEYFDTVIVGAGIAGINTAHYLATQTTSRASYVILESRGRIGGTWDLFRYPGIRSDSDLYTFGYSWNPWRGDSFIANGSEILTYLSESAAISGVDEHIRFNHRVISAEWSSGEALWTVKAGTSEGESKSFRARFLVLGTGYYDHDQPMPTVIPGIDTFKAPVVEPQFWPQELDVTDKHIMVVGSGATAVTLVPSLAEDAKHVTMLQRSPSYIAVRSTQRSTSYRILQSVLPSSFFDTFLRAQNIVMGYLMYTFCTLFPNTARNALIKATSRLLPEDTPTDPHFSPRYNPWDQRLCLSPNGDLFAAMRSGKASVITDTIEAVTENEVCLSSGSTLHPDIIVAATGLKMRFAGGIQLTVDGEVVDPAQKFMLRGCMLQDIPNMMFMMGYVNASWTLGAETTSTYLVRLLRAMAANGTNTVVPRVADAENMEITPAFNLSSTYVKKAGDQMPKCGQGLWAQRRNYMVDMWKAKWGDAFGGLEVQ